MAQASTIHKTISLLPRQKGFLKRFIEEPTLKKEVVSIKKILSKEKINIIYAIKNKKPNSIYELSKILNKDFKSIHENVNILQEQGIISLKKIKNGKRISLQPVLNVKKIELSILF